MQHVTWFFRYAAGGLGTLLLGLLLAPSLHADGDVAGATGPARSLAPSEAIFFDGWHYRPGARKAQASITLGADRLYAIVKPKDLDPIFDISDTQSAPPVRSVLLGSDLGMLVRYGRSTYVRPPYGIRGERASGDFRVFTLSQPELRLPFGQSYNDFILYRKKVWPHGPPGVAICRWNRWNEINDDTWMAKFLLANEPEDMEDLDVSVRKDALNMAWIEIFGKGTEFHVRIKSQGERVLKGKSDGGGRDNTYNLRKVGMSLDEVEWRWEVSDESGKGRPARVLPDMAVTAPTPTWTAASGWVGSPSVGSTGVKIGGAESASPPPATPPAPPPAAPPAVSKLPVLAGVWRQQAVSPATPEAEVVIGTSNAKPGAFACRIAKMKIFGMGTLRADRTLEASFGAANPSMTGMQGVPLANVKGKVTAVDGQNRATRIEWANGVVYVRIR